MMNEFIYLFNYMETHWPIVQAMFNNIHMHLSFRICSFVLIAQNKRTFCIFFFIVHSKKIKINDAIEID